MKYWHKPEVMKKKAEYIRERYANDKKFRKYMLDFGRQYYQDNKDILKRRASKRNRENAEDIKEYQRDYYQKNKKALKKYQKKYQEDNREKINEYMRNYRKKIKKAE
jgi:ribose 1,5-bisphosphokinase PhnN